MKSLLYALVIAISMASAALSAQEINGTVVWTNTEDAAQGWSGINTLTITNNNYVYSGLVTTTSEQFGVFCTVNQTYSGQGSLPAPSIPSSGGSFSFPINPLAVTYTYTWVCPSPVTIPTTMGPSGTPPVGIIATPSANGGYSLSTNMTYPPNSFYGGSVTTVTASGTLQTSCNGAALSVVSGDSQTGLVDQMLSVPLVVKVANAAGSCSGVQVSFQVTKQPSGSSGTNLGSATATTGSNGNASTDLTLGSLSGQYQVTASCSSCNPASVLFTETAQEGRLTLSAVSTPLTGLARSGSQSPVEVSLKDSVGNPVQNVGVTFTITQDPDTVALGPTRTLATLNPPSGTSVATGPTGIASTQFTGGATPGVYIVTASCATSVTCTPATVQVAILVGCTVTPAVPSFSQGGPKGFTNPEMPWGSDDYDHLSGKEIFQKGCGLTALAMAINFAAGKSLDPGSFSTILYPVPGAYNADHGMQWNVDVAALKTNLMFSALPWIDSGNNLTGAETAVENQICAVSPHPVIVGVRSLTNPDKYPGHYVLITGVKILDPKGNRQYAINDPAGASSTLPSEDYYLSHSGGPEFQTRGTVIDPENLSSLSVSVDAATDITLIDPSGNQTGFGPGAVSPTQNIPNSAAFVDEFDDDAPPGDPGAPSEVLIADTPVNGNYTISLTGSSTTGASPYILNVNVIAQDGSIQSQLQIPGISAPGSNSTIKLSLSSLPGLSSLVTPQVTFASTLSDVSNSLALGLIANSREADLLSDSIRAAQKTTAVLQVLAIKQFAVLVDALALENQITGVAPAVLLQDAKALLGLNAPSPRLGTITGRFNRTAIQEGDFLWFSSSVEVEGLLPGIPTSVSVTGASVSFESDGTVYNLPVPKGTIEFSPAATTSTTTFDTVTGEWQTIVPFSGIGANAFLSGLAFQVTAPGLSDEIRNVTWTGTFSSDTPGIVADWRWGAAAYSQFSTDYTSLGVQPVSSAGKPAGSPLNLKLYLLPGGTGFGGSDYIGEPAGSELLSFGIPSI